MRWNDAKTKQECWEERKKKWCFDNSSTQQAEGGKAMTHGISPHCRLESSNWGVVRNLRCCRCHAASWKVFLPCRQRPHDARRQSPSQMKKRSNGANEYAKAVTRVQGSCCYVFSAHFDKTRRYTTPWLQDALHFPLQIFSHCYCFFPSLFSIA